MFACGQGTTDTMSLGKNSQCDVMKESTGEWNDVLLSSMMRVGSVSM